MAAPALKLHRDEDKREESHSERIRRVSSEVAHGNHERITGFSTEALLKLISGN